ncbi:peptide/nickel transport system ATP-binding protein [Actinoplanes lutulentus]|uniref:Peptide/nickel transport system ATP-binding protein n=1 Tax=Actinoplanes lutulentus TaxID=1287878 RepID=A0A327ZLD9_9ACTN|nr:ABC transporter ATP-binding protein [Actinoplanes lutulentus]MBB2940811.1 peptide/nickel transport system ATP-binding protein [Actinoplanes lutulentus]RAK43121.1 peptide/nickel transport system ATP-binding protein [Actinoplanes lutulentus]
MTVVATRTETVLDVRDLRIGLADTPIVHGVDIRVPAGKSVGLVGESGSGKTLTALAIAGLLPPAITITGGTVTLAGKQLSAVADRHTTEHRVATIGVVFQNPTPSLNPRMRISKQLHEALPQGTGRREAAARIAELLGLVGITDIPKTLHAFPHELSGGLNQRVVIAMALARDPKLLIADEPTTALDVSVQAQVLDLVDSLRERLGLGVLLVSHDIGIIADRTDEVHVMSEGRIVESGPTADVLRAPRHAYTRQLLSATPSRLARVAPPAKAAEAAQTPQLTLRDLRRSFSVRGREGRTKHVALDGVDLTLHRGQAIGLVGESGSGKTTLARIVVGLERADSGEVRHDGLELSKQTREQRRQWRRDVQYIFQDPYSSLDPRLSVAQTLREPLELNHRGLSRAEVSRRIDALLDEVELPRDFRHRHPSELSGGQRQRVGIARALASEPTLVIADEPVSALDLSVQARILRLLARLRAERDLTYLFISHDLAVVRYLCDDVVVLRDGRIVEQGRTDDVLRNPRDPYTQTLVDAIPGGSL